MMRVAEAVGVCRTTIAEANASLGRQSQPGLRSGFLNPFTFIAGDEDVGEGTCLTVVRERGASAHSAIADASPPSLVERTIETAPCPVTLYARNPEQNVVVGQGKLPR